MRSFISGVIFFLFVAQSYGQVIQWRGDTRDGHFRNEKNLMTEWPEEGPELVLKAEGIGAGYSSPVLSEGTIFVTGMKDTLDYLTALDMTGKVLWQVPYGRSWVQSFPESRSSPIVEGSFVYVMSGTGRLSCLNATNGSVVWSVDVDKDYEAQWHTWGVAETPLIMDEKIICSPGGSKNSVVAFNKETGQELWRSRSEERRVG